jgi:hypothetical protein
MAPIKQPPKIVTPPGGHPPPVTKQNPTPPYRPGR